MNALSLIQATVEPTHVKLDSIQFHVAENPDDLSGFAARELGGKIRKILAKHGFQFGLDSARWEQYDNGDFYQVGDDENQVSLPDKSKAMVAGRELKAVFEDAGFQHEMNFDPTDWVRELYKHGAKEVVATVEPQEVPNIGDAYEALVENLVKRQGANNTRDTSRMLVVPGKSGLSARISGFQYQDTFRIYVTVFAPSLEQSVMDRSEEDFYVESRGSARRSGGLNLCALRIFSSKSDILTLDDGDLTGRLQADCAVLVRKLEKAYAQNFWKIRYHVPGKGNQLVSLAVVNKIRAAQEAKRIGNA